MTSSAVASSSGGTVRPTAFAVLRFTSVFRLSELLTIGKDACRPQPVGLRGYSLLPASVTKTVGTRWFAGTGREVDKKAPAHGFWTEEGREWLRGATEEGSVTKPVV
jgi:hypothetical protein